jgi:hypothetical protein
MGNWYNVDSLRSILKELSCGRRTVKMGVHNYGSSNTDYMAESYDSSAFERRKIDCFRACDRYYRIGPTRPFEGRMIQIFGQLAFALSSPFIVPYITVPWEDFSLVSEKLDGQGKPEPVLVWLFRPNGNVFIQEYHFREKKFALFAIRQVELEKAPQMIHYYDYSPVKLDNYGMMFRGVPIYVSNQDAFVRMNWRRIIEQLTEIVSWVVDSDGFFTNDYLSFRLVFNLSQPDWNEQT